MTSREKLLKRRPKPVEIDGETIYVRSMTLAEVMRAESLQGDPAKQHELLAFVVSSCVVEKDGSAVFSGPDDSAIRELPLDVLRELTDKIGKSSSAGNLAAIEKNSEATP